MRLGRKDKFTSLSFILRVLLNGGVLRQNVIVYCKNKESEVTVHLSDKVS